MLLWWLTFTTQSSRANNVNGKTCIIPSTVVVNIFFFFHYRGEYFTHICAWRSMSAFPWPYPSISFCLLIRAANFNQLGNCSDYCMLLRIQTSKYVLFMCSFSVHIRVPSVWDTRVDEPVMKKPYDFYIPEPI